MATLSSFLSNPLVAFIGYILSLIASGIAIWQYIGKTAAIKEVSTLKQIVEQNKIQLGDKSQYFHENSGQVTIDNRD